MPSQTLQPEQTTERMVLALPGPALSTPGLNPAHAKRQRLREIVERLGPTATPAAIREEAYRVGFGPVSSPMLVLVRNALWPDRHKHAGGRTPRPTVTALFRPPAALPGEVVCLLCGSPNLRIRDVFRLANGNLKRRRQCQACGHKFYSVEVDTGKALHPRRLLARAATEKECATCRRVLSIACFSKKANDADLYRSSCRQCLNRQRSERLLQDALARHRATEGQYQGMLRAQGGRCSICGTDGRDAPVTRRTRHRFLRIDHCHKTGVVRGLLCDTCNLGIGNFKDDPLWLETAAAYLRRHQRPLTDSTYSI